MKEESASMGKLKYVPICYQMYTMDSVQNLLVKPCILLCILWHVDPLFGNDHEVSNYTTAISK
jgi:hypothetical protein